MMPLDGYRLLDLSRLMPGPSASHLLADMGMDVIKVEEPLPRAGMPRDMLSPFIPDPDEEVRYSAYNALARNKKSVAINLKSEEGREIFYKLVKGADAVMEGYRPGVAAKLGVDYETLRAINPGIVYCSITGYGQDGPYQMLPGHDPNYCSIAGQLQLQRSPDGYPVNNGFPMADISAGVHAAMGIMAALIAREKTGSGQFIDVSLTHSVMNWLVWAASAYFRDGQRYVLGEPGGDPGVSVLKCRDGKFLTTANGETHFWANFCNAIGHPEYIELQRPAPEKRPAYQAMVEDVKALFLTKDRDEWFKLLAEADTCVAPVLEIDEVFEDPGNLHRGMLLEVDHPVHGKVKQIGPTLKFSETPFQFERFAPVLGQHTHEILLEAGYSEGDIETLAAGGAVRVWEGDPMPEPYAP